MGTLVAWHYPTTLFAKLADHTYVACGTGGKAWSCWGGKTGGTILRSGPGSTLRADAIAEPDEKANIKCYLVNGVCHQCANRILLPAGITVRGAKGYWVSESLYGTYGRPSGFLGFCQAPFLKHPGVSGDLPECEEGGAGDEAPGAPELESAARGEPSAVRSYLERVQARYEEADAEVARTRPALERAEADPGFQLSLFELMVDYKLDGEYLRSSSGAELMEVRAQVEAERLALEEEFFTGGMPVDEFVARYNDLIERYQEQCAQVLPPDGYRQLFEEERGDSVWLGDPRVAAEAYRDRIYGAE